MITKELIKTAKEGEGYVSYIGAIQPSTGKPEEKTSFVKGIKGWNWTIGSGAYINDIENIIIKKRIKYKDSNSSQLFKIIIVSTVVFIILFVLSLYFVKSINNRFNKYKEKVEEKTLQLKELNEQLEEKVTTRTKNLSYINKKLKNSIEDLSKTKKDLLLAEKMAILGELVGSITHEINSPLGICITSSSYLDNRTHEIMALFEKEEMTKEDFNEYINSTIELTKILSINLRNTRNLVRSFKTIAVDQATEDIRKFNLKDYIYEILLSLKSKTKKTKIDIFLECDANIILHSYPGYLSQILTNLINNSILHGFKKNEEGEIRIRIVDFKECIEIIYSDNGVGIPTELREKIFDKYFTTKKGSGGTGLGLHIIKEIVVDKLNGNIRINTKKEKGTKFLIKIPKVLNIDSLKE